MGNANTFCECNNIRDGIESNLGWTKELNNYLCPFGKNINSNKRDESSFNMQNKQDRLSKDEERILYILQKNAAIHINNAVRQFLQNKHRNSNNYNNIGMIKNNKNKRISKEQIEEEITTANLKNNLSENKQSIYNDNEKIRFRNNYNNHNNNNNNNEFDLSNNNVSNYDKESENVTELTKSPRLRQMSGLLGKSISYVGGELNNQKDGFGIQIWNNEAKYKGFYKNGKANGLGMLVTGNDQYLGEFENDGASGYGCYSKGDKLKYEGYWKNDSQETYGIEIWKDGSQYMGEYHKAKKHGVGVYTWSDGSVYEGEWNNNALEGYGIYYLKNGRVYLGQWKNNNKEGFGQYISEDKKYIGYYANDKKEGFGIYYRKGNNDAYMGFWKAGNQFGFGKYMNKRRNKYGKWRDNKNVDWFENEEEGVSYLEENGLSPYKVFFDYTLEDIINYCEDGTYFENLLKPCNIVLDN